MASSTTVTGGGPRQTAPALAAWGILVIRTGEKTVIRPTLLGMCVRAVVSHAGSLALSPPPLSVCQEPLEHSGHGDALGRARCQFIAAFRAAIGAGGDVASGWDWICHVLLPLLLLTVTGSRAGRLVARIVHAARWQRAVRRPLVAVGALAGAVADGVRLLLGSRTRRS
jgi:hypothetical protein